MRYCSEQKLPEDTLFCHLEGKATGQEIFSELKNFMQEEALQWSNCVGVCTDGAGAMMGEKRTESQSSESCTRCSFHTLFHTQLNCVFQAAIKTVNFVKALPVTSILSRELGSEHELLLLHTEVLCMSPDKVLQRLF